MTSFKQHSRKALPISAAAFAIALVAACGNGDDGTEPTDTEMTTPTTTAEMTTEPPAGELPAGEPPAGDPGAPVEPVIPPENAGEAPVQNNTPTTRDNGPGLPGQTTSLAPSAEPPVVETPSPPTGDTLPGQDQPPQGIPGTPGGN